MKRLFHPPHKGTRAVAARRPNRVRSAETFAAAAAFTLIELMMVIMLLTVLLLTAFPAYRGLERSANRHRAIAEADSLAQAALAYRRVYGQWPLEDEAAVPGEATAIVAGRSLQTQHLALSNVVRVLRNAWPEHNPRRIRFLELPGNALDADGTPLDPWHRPYVLVMTRHGANHEVARLEGGVRWSMNRKYNPADRHSPALIVEGPSDAVAFSWGDPASLDDEPCLFSWSRR